MEVGKETFMVVGEYPTEYQDDSFRCDIKVLHYCDTIEEANQAMKNFEREGYEMLSIYRATKVVQGF